MARGELTDPPGEVSPKGQMPSPEGQGPKRHSVAAGQNSSPSRVEGRAWETNTQQEPASQPGTRLELSPGH